LPEEELPEEELPEEELPEEELPELVRWLFDWLLGPLP